MSVHVEKFVFNAFQENTFIVHDGVNCVIIDPGCYERSEYAELKSFLENNTLTPQALLLTHAHIDHVLGCSVILDEYDIPFYIHEKDVVTLNAVGSYAHVYGFPGYLEPKMPDHVLQGGEVLEFGEIKFNVYFTPGHAPGHVVYHDPRNNFVINGDVLFAGSFGRVDLPGGNLTTLKDSIYNTMFNLSDETVVYCGHGPETTIGREKVSNFIHQF